MTSIFREHRPTAVTHPHRTLTALLGAVAVALAACGHMTAPPSAPGEPLSGGLYIPPSLLNTALAGKIGLCTGKGGLIEACTPRPRVNFGIDKPMTDIVNALSADQRPARVVCGWYREDNAPPQWQCVGIYDAVPR